MTLQSNYLVSISDISGVEFECLNSNCGLKLTFDVRKTDRPTAKCPSCYTKWMSEDTQEYAYILRLFETLRSLDEQLKGRNLMLRLLIPALSVSQKLEQVP
jgi:hypothetical protein